MILQDMPFEQYLAHPAVNNSLLKKVAKCPALAKAYLDGEEIDSDTPAMKLGRVTHCLSLERDEFSKRYAVEPEVNRRTKDGKAELATFAESNHDKEIIRQETYDSALAMAVAVRRHKMASLLLNRAEFEVSMFAEIEGVECKVRLDVSRQDGIVSDLKTCADASPNAFARACANLDYLCAAALYIDVVRANGIPADSYVWIAVESSEPHLVALYSATQEDVEIGRTIYRDRLETFKRCRDSGVWPGYGDGKIQPLAMPKWWGNKNMNGGQNEY